MLVDVLGRRALRMRLVSELRTLERRHASDRRGTNPGNAVDPEPHVRGTVRIASLRFAEARSTPGGSAESIDIRLAGVLGGGDGDIVVILVGLGDHRRQVRELGE